MPERPIDTWREKLEFLRAEEAKASDPAQKFSLRKQIEEAEGRIAELELDRPTEKGLDKLQWGITGKKPDQLRPTTHPATAESLDSETSGQGQTTFREAPGLMPKVFISYRRDDGAYPAQAIYQKLAEHYGAESVVFDVDTIPVGVDFVEYLNQQVSECDVLLAVIGDSWLDVLEEDGSRRIDNENDWVRIEIRAALKRAILVIPVLVGKASIPKEDRLPDELKPLSRRNATEVRAGRDFQTHLVRLVRGIDVSLKHVSRSVEPATPPESPPSKELPGKVGRDSSKRKPTTRTTTGTSSVASTPTHPPAESGTDTITSSIDMKLKLLGPGTFLIGNGGSKPQVKLTELFLLGIYPVTQAEYKRVTKTNPSRFKDDERCPVDSVSWFSAVEFCNRLSEKEGLRPYYEVKGDKVTTRGGEGYRLPTEAEWEYACRAETTTQYCFGDDEKQLGDYGWFDGNSDRRTQPVGAKQPNPWGLYDMHGNVWEWCWDWYDDYPESPQENPTGPTGGSDRVYRGGGWSNVARFCRSAFRGRFLPESRGSSLGFRLARSSV